MNSNDVKKLNGSGTSELPPKGHFPQRCKGAKRKQDAPAGAGADIFFFASLRLCGNGFAPLRLGGNVFAK
jgi:hypothetical protein